MSSTARQRTCIVCRNTSGKTELIRVVRTPEGQVRLDATGKANGRGAYLCPNAECLKKAIRAKALERAFETAIPAEIYDRLREEMERGE